jgi:hypothetical protein
VLKKNSKKTALCVGTSPAVAKMGQVAVLFPAITPGKKPAANDNA